MKTREGAWLDARQSLGQQCTPSSVLLLRAPPQSVVVETPSHPEGVEVSCVLFSVFLSLMLLQVKIELSDSVGDVMKRCGGNGDLGLWVRERGVEYKAKQSARRWLEEDATLMQLGIESFHILRLEARPYTVRFSYNAQEHRVEATVNDTVSTLLAKCQKNPGLR